MKKKKESVYLTSNKSKNTEKIQTYHTVKTLEKSPSLKVVQKDDSEQEEAFLGHASAIRRLAAALDDLQSNLIDTAFEKIRSVPRAEMKRCADIERPSDSSSMALQIGALKTFSDLDSKNPVFKQNE